MQYGGGGNVSIVAVSTTEPKGHDRNEVSGVCVSAVFSD